MIQFYKRVVINVYPKNDLDFYPKRKIMSTKKEQKDFYKKMKFKAGVFQIKNTVNQKIFIGSSIDLDAIWNRIKTELRFGNYLNTELQNDWKKFGEENFVYEILSEIKQEEETNINYRKEARQLEEMFVEELQPFGDKGYNTQKESRKL